MTLNDLIKQIPESMRDNMIYIYIPITTAEEAGEYPLIDVTCNSHQAVSVLLEADYK